MNVRRRDLNLLPVFKALYEERNLTAAAERMALSQPALSHKLNKLRHEFGDPLFVRAPRGLTPTPRAHTLAEEVLGLVTGIEAFYQEAEGEDFLARPDRINVHTTDYVEQLLFPTLLPRVHSEAPNLQVVCHNTRGRLPRKALESGECDIAIAGFFRDLPATYHQEPIYSEGFAVLAGRSNPYIRQRLTLAAYLRCRHIVTTLTGDLRGLVDAALRKQGKTRQVVAGLSSFIAPPMIVRESDFIVTCLRSIAERAASADAELRVFPCPVHLDDINVVQAWHDRTHRDPMRRWLRDRIRQCLNGVGPDHGK